SPLPHSLGAEPRQRQRLDHGLHGVLVLILGRPAALDARQLPLPVERRRRRRRRGPCAEATGPLAPAVRDRAARAWRGRGLAARRRSGAWRVGGREGGAGGVRGRGRGWRVDGRRRRSRRRSRRRVAARCLLLARWRGGGCVFGGWVGHGAERLLGCGTREEGEHEME
ncbi:hypothetical protein GGS23DRAFT_619114, partial [Durotheca rogersii]|uniref:uncharacterized protein n=1 Tax=Durotheca rogersii TaxID=419775 RepID=UPI00221FF848